MVPICASLGIMFMFLIYDYFYDRVSPSGNIIADKMKSFEKVPALFFFSCTANMIVSFCAAKWYFSRTQED